MMWSAQPVSAMWTMAQFARVLRRRGSGESELASADQHQIANVNKRVRKISQDANRIAPENKIKAHQRASRDAPVPERHRNHAFALAL